MASLAPAQFLPAGVVSSFAGSTAPAGWLLCDGSAVSRTTYAALFSAISTTYGAGDGSTTFNVPNLKGRTVVGYDAAQSEFDAMGETGGAKTHTLTESEMPAHTHVQDAHTHTQVAHTHSATRTSAGGAVVTGTGVPPHNGVAAPGGDMTFGNTTPTINSQTATNQNTGGGAAHNNLQPYVVLNFIVKV